MDRYMDRRGDGGGRSKKARRRSRRGTIQQ
jgi:hypothetical protein